MIDIDNFVKKTLGSDWTVSPKLYWDELKNNHNIDIFDKIFFTLDQYKKRSNNQKTKHMKPYKNIYDGNNRLRYRVWL